MQKLGDVTGSDVRLPERDVEQVRRLYDGSVAAVDAAIGRLLERVDDQTVVVLLADHGENLFEPGNTTFHGKWFRGGDEANSRAAAVRGAEDSAAARARAGEPGGRGADAAGFGSCRTRASTARPLPAFSTGHAPEHEVFAETAVWLSGPPEPDGRGIRRCRSSSKPTPTTAFSWC